MKKSKLLISIALGTALIALSSSALAAKALTGFYTGKSATAAIQAPPVNIKISNDTQTSSDPNSGQVIFVNIPGTSYHQIVYPTPGGNVIFVKNNNYMPNVEIQLTDAYRNVFFDKLVWNQGEVRAIQVGGELIGQQYSK